MSGIIENCKHLNTKIWEPHLAGARKCLSCDMVYNPNMGGWHVEEQSIETQLSNLKSKHEKVLEMLNLACETLNIIINTYYANMHPTRTVDNSTPFAILAKNTLDEIERLKK